jgi:7,8-dihydro-6-hydroxymethylpterin-pyrophosphokinase
MPRALIALGGNVGDVRATFQKAIGRICAAAQAVLLARSSDYATPPWGDERQARFINACIVSIRTPCCSRYRRSKPSSAAIAVVKGAGGRARLISI